MKANLKNIAINAFLLCFICTYSFAQEVTKKGTINIIWGWNKEYYSNSKIHFKGDNYSFDLYDVRARDKWQPIALDPHFKIDEITIPQTNLRIGYFIKDNVELSLGVDHMKYVMVQDQRVRINGFIDDGSAYDGVYIADDSIVLTEEFLQFEHTDGLNYGNLELGFFRRLNPWLGIPQNKYFNVDGYVGFGAGLLVPKTNAKLWSQDRNDKFYLSGFGLGGKIGFNFEVLRWIIFRYEWKVGYINMPWIRTTQYKADKASQAFVFSENYLAFGFQHKF